MTLTLLPSKHASRPVIHPSRSFAVPSLQQQQTIMRTGIDGANTLRTGA
jgi:hypothetical protein